MAHSIYKDNSRATIQAAVGLADTSITIDDSTLLPVPGASQIVYATLRGALTGTIELISYTSNVANVISGITRNVNGDGNNTFSIGDFVEIRIPNVVLSEFIQRQGDNGQGDNDVTGNLHWADAAGPAILNEAATTTNPTLIPNKAETDTGWGWASDELHAVLGGVDTASFEALQLALPVAAYAIDHEGATSLTLNTDSNSLIVSADGDGGGTGVITYQLSSANAWTMSAATGLAAANAAGPAILNEAASASNPTVVANKTDLDTGWGWLTDEIWAVTGGVSAMRIASDTTQELHLFNYDNDATVGPVFKLTRAKGGSAGTTNTAGTADDILASINFEGFNNAGLPAQKQYAGLVADIVDPTSTSEKGALRLDVMGGVTAGTVASILELYGVGTGASAAGQWNMGTDSFFSSNATGPAILNEAATNANPTLIPNRAELDDGMGHYVNGTTSGPVILANGERLFYIEHTTGTNHTKFMHRGIRDDAGGGDPYLTLYKDRATTSTGQVMGTISWEGDNQSDIYETWGTIRVKADNPQFTVEDGSFVFAVQRSSNLLDIIEFRGDVTQGTGLVMNPNAGNCGMISYDNATNTSPNFIIHENDLTTGLGGVSNPVMIDEGSQVCHFFKQGTGVNYWRLANSGPSTPIICESLGSDATVDMDFRAKGADAQITFKINNATTFVVDGDYPIASGIDMLRSSFANGPGLVNEICSQTNPTLLPNSSEPTTGIGSDNGTEHVYLITLGATVLECADSGGTPVNYFRMTNSDTTLPPTIDVEGTDTNIGLDLNTKGTGDLRLLYGGSPKFAVTGDVFEGLLAAGGAMLNENASSTNPTFAPNKADPDTGLGWSSSDNGALVAGGVASMFFSGNEIHMPNAAGPAMLNEAATTTNPTLVPNRADTDTGIGWNTNEVHVVSGGAQKAYFKDDQFETLNIIDTTDNGFIGPTLKLTRDTGAGAVSTDFLGCIQWHGDDSLGATVEYGRISMEIKDPLLSALDSSMDFAVRTGGTELTILTLDGTNFTSTFNGAYVTCTNGSAPALVNETPSTTNPTLVPNVNELDTGWGWASDTLVAVLGGAASHTFTTTTYAGPTTTVAGLPAAGTAGRRSFVTDANATTFASVVAGGGANGVPVYDDGTNWRIG